MRPLILTANGDYFNLAEPEGEHFDISVIAQALSKINRFTGHTREFYSVAQHCVLVARNLPPHLALQGLLHDATEAYLGDVSAPLKAMLPDYRAIEARVEAALLAHFDLPPVLDPLVKRMDLVLLATEKRDLMPHNNGDAWAMLRGVECLPDRIVALPHAEAEAQFLSMYTRLTGRLRRVV